MDKTPTFPVINGFEYLINHLNKIGWSSSNGMGISPISWVEIDAYNRCHNYALSDNEMDIIKEMSRAYVNNVQDKNPNKKAPYKEI